MKAQNGRALKRNQNPEGPSTQYLRLLVPKTILFMVFGTRELKCEVLGPSGEDSQDMSGFPKVDPGLQDSSKGSGAPVFDGV